MRHKYLTAVRHPRRRFSLTLHLILSPRARGLMNFFFNHRHRRKLTSSPVRRAASTTRSPLDSPREYASNLANACAVNTWTRIHYTCTLQRKEKKRGGGKREKQNSSNRGPFSWRDGRVLTSDRTVNLRISLVNRGNNITRFDDTMFNSNYNFNFNYSRFEIDSQTMIRRRIYLEREEDDESRVSRFFFGKKQVAFRTLVVRGNYTHSHRIAEKARK